VRLNYKRNTVDVDDAINQLKLQKPPIKAVSWWRLPGRRQVHRKDATTSFPGLIYHQRVIPWAAPRLPMNDAAGTALCQRRHRHASCAAVSGYSSIVLEYKNALAKYFPAKRRITCRWRATLAANVLIQGLKRAGPQLDTEKLIGRPWRTRAISTWVLEPISVLAALNHQASHKIWGNGAGR